MTLLLAVLVIQRQALAHEAVIASRQAYAERVRLENLRKLVRHQHRSSMGPVILNQSRPDELGKINAPGTLAVESPALGTLEKAASPIAIDVSSVSDSANSSIAHNTTELLVPVVSQGSLVASSLIVEPVAPLVVSIVRSMNRLRPSTAPRAPPYKSAPPRPESASAQLARERQSAGIGLCIMNLNAF